jgi:chromosome segregation ATPase
MALLRDIRGGRARLRDLPDLSPLKRETEKYAEMAAEVDAARRKVRELEGSRPQAKQADRDKFAKVILTKGAKAPDQPGTEQARLEEEIAKAKTRREACETALDVAEAKLIEAVRAKRSELLRDVDQGVEKIERDFAAAAEKLIALRAQRDDAANLRAWVAGFPDQLIELRKTSRPFYGIKTISGAPLSAAAFVAALREDVTGPKPAQPEFVSDAEFASDAA